MIVICVSSDPPTASHAAKPLVDQSILVPEVTDALPRVIIGGFGRVGQTVAGMLEVCCEACIWAPHVPSWSHWMPARRLTSLWLRRQGNGATC